MNFLEDLAAEWFEYSGYFVRSNIRTRKRSKGGYDCELDVLAYKPAIHELIHIETSGDSDSWAERENRFRTKKFILSVGEYTKILGAPVSKVRKIAIVGQSKTTKKPLDWGDDIEIWLIPKFLGEIADHLRRKHHMSEAVPEGYPMLRTIQMIIGYKV